MSDFRIEDWCDYVRGVAGADRTAAMKRELEAGNESPRRTVEALSRVSELSQADRDYRPPDAIVDAAKAVFSVHEPARRNVWQQMKAILVPDSDLAPLPVGMRGVGSDQELRFSTENVTVSLRVEQGAEGFAPVIVGEIIEEKNEALPLENVALLASNQVGIVGHGVSGPFGEFELPIDDSRRPISITAILGEGRIFSLELPDLSTARCDPPADWSRG